MNEESSNLSLYKSFNLHLVDPSWQNFFFQYLPQEYFGQLLVTLEGEYQKANCYPKKENVFRLFREIALEKVKVVILGQDPYYQAGVADGLAFSNQKPNYMPLTLQNIFRELKSDLGYQIPLISDLLSWVHQGVFLLNTALTVKESKPLSHTDLWKEFTYSLVNYLNKQNPQLIWIFWGQKARQIKEKCQIASTYALISPHPSPLSADYGFFGSKPFSKINKILAEMKKEVINWKLDQQVKPKFP